MLFPFPLLNNSGEDIPGTWSDHGSAAAAAAADDDNDNDDNMHGRQRGLEPD